MSFLNIDFIRHGMYVRSNKGFISNTFKYNVLLIFMFSLYRSNIVNIINAVYTASIISKGYL